MNEVQPMQRSNPYTGGIAAMCVVALSVAASMAAGQSAAAQTVPTAERLAEQVVIRRTMYGVPHITAENVRSAFFGMAYVQLQDYGLEVVEALLEARGELARYRGYDEIDSDFVNRRAYLRAVETYHLLPEDTRAALEGFAAGVNFYIELHPDEFPAWVRPQFTGYDAAARDVRSPSLWDVRELIERIEERRADQVATSGAAGSGHATTGGASRATTAGADHATAAGAWPGARNPWALAARHAEAPHPDAGSNAWALAPGRTESGHAILVRNPHLGWDAGYYEAQLTIPGDFNFYGDFRIGGPFSTIGGFNEHLGWATTNNDPDLDEVYTLRVDPERPDHYLFNGASLPIQRSEITVTFKNGDGLGRETRVFLETPLGPVVHRGDGKIYIYRAGGVGEFRLGTQLLRMLRAETLEEWKAAMSMRADPNSNYTYADDDGNIFLIWNASIPALPHRSGGDTAAVPASRTSQVWTRLVPFDSLPMILNPEGGYVLNSNDSFHYYNLNEIMDPADFPPYFHGPEFDLRSQHSVLLWAGGDELSLEEVVRRKHSMRMLLADRVKADLVEAVRATDPTGEVAEAIALIEDWDNTVARESRGGVLFKTWWWEYEARIEESVEDESDDGDAAGVEPPPPFSDPWTADRPMETPRGLSHPDIAAAAFAWAVEETAERWGDWDVAWGEVHRVRHGEVDVPVGGCTGSLGCFRVLWFDEAEDGKLVADGGDGWVVAVEFSDPPRAYSILAYGQSSQPESPYYDAQAAMFARNEMKPVAYTEEQIEDQLIRSYHPGEEIDRD